MRLIAVVICNRIFKTLYDRLPAPSSTFGKKSFTTRQPNGTLSSLSLSPAGAILNTLPKQHQQTYYKQAGCWFSISSPSYNKANMRRIWSSAKTCWSVFSISFLLQRELYSMIFRSIFVSCKNRVLVSVVVKASLRFATVRCADGEDDRLGERGNDERVVVPGVEEDAVGRIFNFTPSAPSVERWQW